MNFSEFKNRFQKTPVTEYPNKVSNKPKVSICVPTHNHKFYIADCLQSILCQKTNFDFEILLGDDESTDGTEKICLEFARNFPDKIRFFSHKQMNNIQVEGSSTGIFNALYSLYTSNGKYIAYCDGDDYWGDDNKLQIQVDFLESNSEYVLNFHRVTYLNSELKQTIDLKEPEKDLSAEHLKKVITQPLLISVLFRNIVKEFPISLTQIINSDNFITSLLGHYGKGKYLSSIKPAFYRIHSESIWSSKKREKQLYSKMKTSQVIANYYNYKKINNLHFYFKTQAYNYNKMLIVLYFKNFKLLKGLVAFLYYCSYKFQVRFKLI